MHPARIIPLQRLPTNSCHKVDRRVIEALPLPNRKESKADNRPLSLAEMAMQALWRDLLPDFALIEPGTDFFAAGGNSTLLVRLQAAIKNSTACSIPLGDLYRAATLRSMAALVGERENAELVKDELEDIDWDRETKPADVTTGKGNDELSSKKQDLEVMMAGGTGLLGKAILQSLLQDPRISRIHCVAIPAEEKPHFLRSVDSPKVVAYSGSLRHPTLGLSEADVAQLEAQVSMLIHAGAEGTCVSRYDSLREANVQSTRWLASFAASLAITMHYISYGRVIPLSGMASYPPASLAAHRPPSRPHDGFVASKWASERILEATAHHFGLQAFIHRPCSLSSDKALSTDALAALVHYSPLLRAVPYLPILEGYIDIRDVAELGDDIFQTCLRLQRVGEQKEDQTQATTMFYHYSTGVRIPVADFRKYIEAQVNESVVEIPYAEWAVKAAELGMDPELVDFVHWKIETGSPVLLPFLGEKH
jgi:nucleoside-diphosphate-sugar epimerase